jgi:methyl-accepting chemotaxis protein
MAIRPYKRRRILIESFQYRLLLINLIYFVTILLIFAAALFLPLILQLRSNTLSVVEQGEVAGLFLSLHARVWPAMLVVFILLALHSVFVSHRVAGPLYRFRTIFKAITEGDLTVRAQLRKSDYLGRESDALNEMIASLRTKITDIQNHYEEVQTVLEALEKSVERGSSEDMNHHIVDLRARMERLNSSVDQFRLQPDEGGAEDGSGAPVAAGTTSEDSAPLVRA